jgi:hypothetical protein
MANGIGQRTAALEFAAPVSRLYQMWAQNGLERLQIDGGKWWPQKTRAPLSRRLGSGAIVNS